VYTVADSLRDHGGHDLDRAVEDGLVVGPHVVVSPHVNVIGERNHVEGVAADLGVWRHGDSAFVGR
jgi:hypothetical protein